MKLFHRKRGDTVVRVFMIVGLLILGVVIIASFQRMSSLKRLELEQDFAQQFAERINNAIYKAQNYPSDAEYMVKIPYTTRYKAEIKNNKLTLELQEANIKKSYILGSEGINLLESKFSDSGEILVVKKNDQLYVNPDISCDENSDECDPGCILVGKCPNSCLESADVCNPYCITKTLIDEKPRKCIPACYSQTKNSLYDPKCIVSDDFICDPDTHLLEDGICDNDCLGANSVCDPDCDEPDIDCPSKGNGVCEQLRGENCENTEDCACGSGKVCRHGARDYLELDENGCISESELKQETESCEISLQCANNLICDFNGYCCHQGQYFDENKNECVNVVDDGICMNDERIQETCVTSPNDCACITEDRCCPSCGNALDTGCCPKETIKCGNSCIPIPAENEKLGEGNMCKCSEQCSGELKCIEDPEKITSLACCPSGHIWNSEQKICELERAWKLVIVPVNYNLASSIDKDVNRYERFSNLFFNIWNEESPFKQCPEPRTRMLLLEHDCAKAVSLCYGPNFEACSPNCARAIINCAQQEYSDFNKAEALYKGHLDPNVERSRSGVLGCAGITDVQGRPSGNVYLGNNLGGAIHTDQEGNNYGEGSAHELGHDFGLCHPIGGGARPLPDTACPNTDSGNTHFIMNTGIRNPPFFYSPTAYSHLANHPHLEEYLEDCNV